VSAETKDVDAVPAAAPAVSAMRAPPPDWRHRIDAYERLIRLDKPIGTLLLLWPTLTALWFSTYGSPSFTLIAVFVMGTLLMRSAGCAFNDWADSEFDRHVKRTAKRPLAVGEIAPWEALALAALFAAVAFTFLLATNRTAMLWSLPALAISIAYPFFKRFFALPQAFLGLAFSFGIPMAYAAAIGAVPSFAWWLLIANAFWVIAYDTEYAMVDRDDDVRIGIRTSAITFGRYDVLAVAICYLIFLGGMAWLGTRAPSGWIYYAGLGVAFVIALYHLWLIRGRERDKCFRAFLHNHWIGFVIFASVALDYAVRMERWPRVL
jgi:4-hydroxybenzoate polyprenyltransferase